MGVAGELCTTFLTLKIKRFLKEKGRFPTKSELSILPGMVFHACGPFGVLSEQSLM